MVEFNVISIPLEVYKIYFMAKVINYVKMS